jgi:hypothetical protein
MSTSLSLSLSLSLLAFSLIPQRADSSASHQTWLSYSATSPFAREGFRSWDSPCVSHKEVSPRQSDKFPRALSEHGPTREKVAQRSTKGLAALH